VLARTRSPCSCLLHRIRLANYSFFFTLEHGAALILEEGIVIFEEEGEEEEEDHWKLQLDLEVIVGAFQILSHGPSWLSGTMTCPREHMLPWSERQPGTVEETHPADTQNLQAVKDAGVL
jgi:hypothetical protein